MLEILVIFVFIDALSWPLSLSAQRTKLCYNQRLAPIAWLNLFNVIYLEATSLPNEAMLSRVII
mgnify:CR=1 FL=1